MRHIHNDYIRFGHNNFHLCYANVFHFRMCVIESHWSFHFFTINESSWFLGKVTVRVSSFWHSEMDSLALVITHSHRENMAPCFSPRIFLGVFFFIFKELKCLWYIIPCYCKSYISRHLFIAQDKGSTVWSTFYPLMIKLGDLSRAYVWAVVYGDRVLAQTTCHLSRSYGHDPK